MRIPSRTLILYVGLLWSWVWLGGFLLADILGPVGTGIWFLLSPLVLSIVFIILSSDSFADIGLPRSLGDRPRHHLYLSLEYFVVILLAVLGGQILLLDFRIEVQLLVPTLLQVIPILLIVLIQTFAEEIAWAGWLYAKLEALPYYRRVALISAIWIIWHLPFFWWTDQLITLTGFDLLPLLILILHFTISRYLFSWFRWSSKTTWWPAIVHGLSNTSAFILGSVLTGPVENLPYILVLVLVVNLIYCIRLYVSHHPPTQTV